ncbi:MAG TPA: type II secretion system protein [Actinomycetota bacterium]|nr:type II secretion system protein [Actinomycetota bacterium]
MSVLRSQRDDGFTLIELMVVILIIAVLIAVAIPTFLGFRRNAFDVAAKSAVENALKAAKAVYADDDSYVSADPVTLKLTEGSLGYVDGVTPSDGPLTVSVHNMDPSGQVIVLSVYSQSGTCWFLRDDDIVGTQYGSMAGAMAVCFAGNGGVAFGPSW